MSAAGDNTIVSVSAGMRRLIIHYLMYNVETDNTCFWRFGAAGNQQLMRTKVPAESVISRSFDSGFKLPSGVGEALLLNLAVAGAVNFCVFFTEE